jgi:hypothetical protein
MTPTMITNLAAKMKVRSPGLEDTAARMTTMKEEELDKEKMEESHFLVTLEVVVAVMMEERTKINLTLEVKMIKMVIKLVTEENPCLEEPEVT